MFFFPALCGGAERGAQWMCTQHCPLMDGLLNNSTFNKTITIKKSPVLSKQTYSFYNHILHKSTVFLASINKWEQIRSYC